ncbi:MAG: putative zinc-binding metallopeptidase [Marinifilaceae bacterium]|jgi:substrate import-associated zinc metallohydrolase lipoprotein|nr:putative zinc-binding metallopeptidase [Marinifilaceae bacterium]
MKKLLFILSIIILFASCDNSDDDLGNSLIILESQEKSELDKWIYENLTQPYNIEVKYTWDDSELDDSKTLIPPSQEKVKPFLEAVKQIWIDPYEKHGGASFIKSYIPKQIMLVGSSNFNSDGTVTLGQAESGRKITIFEIDQFDITNINILKKQFHTMHHEFGHILHQTVMYPTEFGKITPGDYTSNWTNVSAGDAFNKGFISPYSMLNPNEDFVEHIATFLTNSSAEYNEIIGKISSAEGKQILGQKLTYIVNYFSQVWNIDIYKLQEEISEKLETLTTK